MFTFPCCLLNENHWKHVNISVILFSVVITFFRAPNYSRRTEINMFGFNYSSPNVSVKNLLHHHWTHYTNPVNKPGHNHWIQLVGKCGVPCKVDGD